MADKSFLNWPFFGGLHRRLAVRNEPVTERFRYHDPVCNDQCTH